jgi:hypothetical protein
MRIPVRATGHGARVARPEHLTRRQHMSMLDIAMAVGVIVLVVLIILRGKSKG